MRPNIGSLYLFSAISFLGLVEARPAVGDLVRRQDNNGSSSSSSISSDPTSTTQTDGQSFSFSTMSSPFTNSGSASTASSFPTLVVSTISVPSVTLKTETSSPPSPTSAPDKTPAGFFSNRSATLLLGVTAGGIAGVVLILVLWINFRRSWYFPWNKRKKRNDPNRWSTHSFKEKPNLPLGRNLATTGSTEDFTKRGGGLGNEGHSESHAHSDGHGYLLGVEHDISVPPVPKIRIDSPQSGHWAGNEPPGLEGYSRWSNASSRVSTISMSVYSQVTHSVYDDVRSTGRFAGEERMNTPGAMPSTRVTSSSSENSPFRFDTPYETEYSNHNQPFPSAPRKLTLYRDDREPSPPSTSHIPNPSPMSVRLTARDTRKRSRLADEGPFGRPLRYLPASDDPLQAAPSASSRTGIYFADEQVPIGLERINASADRYRVLSVGVGGDESPTRAFARMDMSPVDLGDHGAAPAAVLAPPKQSPKGILKSPHFLTASARLAGRGNRI